MHAASLRFGWQYTGIAPEDTRKIAKLVSFMDIYIKILKFHAEKKHRTYIIKDIKLHFGQRKGLR